MKKLNITKMKINKKVLSLFLFFVALYFRVRDRCVDWAQSIETVQAVFRRLPTWCRAVVYAVYSSLNPIVPAWGASIYFLSSISGEFPRPCDLFSYRKVKSLENVE